MLHIMEKMVIIKDTGEKKAQMSLYMHIAIAYINVILYRNMMQVDYNESLVNLIQEDSMVDKGYYFEYGPQYKIGTFWGF